MGALNELVSQAAAIGFSVADDLLTDATLHLGKAQTYDPATDTTTASGGQDKTVRGAFYRDKQTQGAQQDVKTASFVVKQADVPAGIDEADTITIAGQVWQIDDVEPTAGAITILRLRQ